MTGAVFTATGGTGTFTWTPTLGQSGTYPGVTFTVVDDGTPAGSEVRSRRVKTA